MLQEDEALLAPPNVHSLSLNKKHAVIVRLGEKRILRATLDEAKKLERTLRAARENAEGSNSKKRGRDVESAKSKPGSKKTRR